RVHAYPRKHEYRPSRRHGREQEFHEQHEQFPHRPEWAGAAAQDATETLRDYINFYCSFPVEKRAEPPDTFCKSWISDKRNDYRGRHAVKRFVIALTIIALSGLVVDSVFAAGKYDPGVSDTEIKLGTTWAFS